MKKLNAPEMRNVEGGYKAKCYVCMKTKNYSGLLGAWKFFFHQMTCKG